MAIIGIATVFFAGMAFGLFVGKKLGPHWSWKFMNIARDDK